MPLPEVSDLAEAFWRDLGYHAEDDAEVPGEVAPAHINKITNPSLEVDLTGYNTTTSFWINDTAVLTRDTSLPAVAGEAMGKVVAPGTKTLEGMKSRAIAGGLELAAGEPVTVSVAVRGAVGGELVKLGVGDGTNGHAESAYVALTTDFQRIAVTLTPTGSGLSNWALVGPNALVAQTFYWDAAQIVDGTEALEYIDGDSPGCEWLGTAGLSASYFPGRNTTYPLLQFCAALIGPLEPIHEIIREGDDGTPPWSVLWDVDECPAWALPHLSMYPGVVLQPGMSEEQQRNEIREPTGWRRGQPQAIKIAARRTLSKEDARVIVRPRTPEAGMHYVRTLLSETPDPERTKAELRAAIPPWEVLDYAAISGVDWVDIEASYPDWDTVAATFTDWDDLEDTLPSELPDP